MFLKLKKITFYVELAMMRYCILRQRFFQAFFLKITMTTADWLLLALHTLSVNRAGMKLRRTPPSVVHICDQLRKRRIVSRVQAGPYSTPVS